MYRWKAKLRFDTRKSKCLRNYLWVICDLREQFIHHSVNCWQFPFPGELIWWQLPALSCHFYGSWEAYSYQSGFWHSPDTQHAHRWVTATLGQREPPRVTREINVAIQEALPGWPQEGHLSALTAEPSLSPCQPWFISAPGACPSSTWRCGAPAPRWSLCGRCMGTAYKEQLNVRNLEIGAYEVTVGRKVKWTA